MECVEDLRRLCRVPRSMWEPWQDPLPASMTLEEHRPLQPIVCLLSTAFPAYLHTSRALHLSAGIFSQYRYNTYPKPKKLFLIMKEQDEYMSTRIYAYSRIPVLDLTAPVSPIASLCAGSRLQLQTLSLQRATLRHQWVQEPVHLHAKHRCPSELRTAAPSGGL
jgi:hypothetical protein